VLTSDDGSKLWIDDRLAIDNDGIHWAIDAANAVNLTAGIHTIRVAYFQGPREEVALTLKVAGPGQRLHVFSTDEFKPPEDWK
jgi:hypothetical protein